MRVLFFTQYFAPEVGATQARTYDMARALVGAGHDVTLVCEVPNHPAGRIWPDYRGKLFVRERFDGIDVLRVWVRTSPTKTYGSRLGFYASYMIMAAYAGIALARGRYDVVFATSPPLLVGAAGLFVTLVRRLPFVFEVRDPWPAAAVALGELRDGFVLRLAQWLERRCYERAARVVTVSDGWRQYLLAQGVPADRIVQIANGANTELFSPQPAAAEALRRKFGLPPDSFVLLYAGLLGLAYDFEPVLKAAARLQEDDGIRFVIAGDGPVKAELMRQAEQRGLSNVLFFDPLPRKEAAALFTMADVAVMPLRDNPFLRGALPAKLFDFWACGTPSLAVADGELRDLVERAAGGVSVAPGDSEALADAVVRLRRSPEQCRAMGNSGLRFVREHYNREVQARTFIDMLEALVPVRQSPADVA